MKNSQSDRKKDQKKGNFASWTVLRRARTWEGEGKDAAAEKIKDQKEERPRKHDKWGRQGVKKKKTLQKKEEN